MAASAKSKATKLVERVAANLQRHADPGQPLCVAWSGGLDSTVLLHCCRQLAWPSGIQAIHVDHGLQSESVAWAEHCRALGAEWGVPLQLRRVDVARNAPGGLELAARKARQAVFAELSPPQLLLAHQADDQAETVLHNLLRGAGVRGLAAMPVARPLPWGGVLLRPLLATTRRELLAYALATGLRWVEDPSNRSLKYTRNRLRLTILPALAEFRGATTADITGRLGATASHCAEAQALLDELADAVLQLCLEPCGSAVRVVDLLRLSPAKQRLALREWFKRLGWQAWDSARIDDLLAQLASVSRGGRPRLRCSNGELQVTAGRLCWQPLAAGSAGASD